MVKMECGQKIIGRENSKMFLIKLNKAQYEYDIHSLVKAFYPEEEVRVLTPESVVKDKRIWEYPARMQIVFGEETVEIQSSNGSLTAEEYTRQFTDNGKTNYKNAFKRFFYEILQKETGISLPWGNLIGIRPTKIAMAMLEAGKKDEEIAAFLKQEHFVSDEKAALGIEIARRENKILQSLHYEDGYSLYIGIPFCPTTCLYCSFTSFPISVWKDKVSAYLDALEKEIEYLSGAYRDKILDTVYIGGGTPTSLSAEELDRLLTKIRESFDFSTVQEFSVEAGRADSITQEKLQVLYRHGVTRISVNPQTMKQETLRLIGRQHTVEQVIDAFHMARAEGFTNINMDMILGLPGETQEDVRQTMEAIERLSPDSLTVHSLAVKRASKLTQWIAENGISAMQNTDKTMRLARESAHRMNMLPYYLYRQKNISGNFENVGYAREGNYGVYNILIMEEKQTIVALGAGTVTKRVYGDGRIERCDTVKDIEGYLERIDEMIERKRKLLAD